MRLGEYDTKTTKDGEHIDIGIARADLHKDYSNFRIFHTNDIAIVELMHDVEFSGKFKFYFYF